MPDPRRGVAWEFIISLVDTANRPSFRVNPTIAAGDFKISKDYGTLANVGTLPVVAPAGGVGVRFQLSATEMTADYIQIIGIDVAGNEWDNVFIYLTTGP